MQNTMLQDAGEQENISIPTANTVSTPSNAQNVQEEYVDYTKLLQFAMPLGTANPDLGNFAYYLYRTDLVKPLAYNDPAWEVIRMNVSFCDCAKMKASSKLMNFSRLEQLYATDIFSDEYYTSLWKKKSDFPDNLKNNCQYCKGGGNCNHAICPYWLCHIIQKAAEVYKIDPEVIFRDMLGNQQISFCGRTVNKLPFAIQQEWLQNIDAKSAHCAYMMILSRAVSLKAKDENGHLPYTYIPLCKGDYQGNIVQTMCDFWKTKSGIMDTINPSDLDSVLKEKTPGCRKCDFVQCPHKLAALFMQTASFLGVPATDLAYAVARGTTYAGTTVGENFQYNKYLSAIRKSSLSAPSKGDLLKILHYIVGRKKNFHIPFLPFNISITAADRENANEIVDIMCNALWYFDYYRAGLDDTCRNEIYLSTTSIADLIKAYEDASQGITFCLYDIPLLCNNKEFKAVYHKLLKLMEDKKTSINTILIGEKEEIGEFFHEYPEFKSRIFTKNLELLDMDNQSVNEALSDKLLETFTIPEDVDNRLTQYIQLAYPASPLRSMDFVNDLYEKILFAHFNHDVNADTIMVNDDIPYITPPRSEQEIFEEINRLTGLDNVKKELKSVYDLVKFNIKMGSTNKNAVNLHMVFNGNPGTGKTTVARLTAEILHSIGFIQENKLVVCSAKDLIGQYMGQTTPLTAKKCEEAYNGVLFIDEAYQLNPYTSGHADTYKEECIAELIQQMENNRDRLVVIFAGYTAEMEDFLNRANTGLRSRIGKVIEFPDYTSEQLLEIFQNIVKRNGLQLDAGAAQKAMFIFNSVRTDSKRFGNARFARNLFERSLMQHAAITSNLDKDDPALRILQSDEITAP